MDNLQDVGLGYKENTTHSGQIRRCPEIGGSIHGKHGIIIEIVAWSNHKAAERLAFLGV